MRQRRDSFGRQTLRPIATKRPEGCTWCGQRGERLYLVKVEPDAGRAGFVGGAFCSWACLEAFHDTKVPR